jgi:hypothetical protein
MKAFVGVLTALTTSIGELELSAPAHAYDADAYEHAAGHMIHTSDTPTALGAFNDDICFGGYSPTRKTWLCSLQQPGSAPEKGCTFPTGPYEFSANYSAKGKNPPSVAVSAFQEAAQGRQGTYTRSWTHPDSGTSSSSTTMTTNAVVHSVQTVGVKSIVSTSYYMTSQLNLSTDRRKAVDQLAVNTQTRLLGEDLHDHHS